jgi:hypothetical protein
LPVASAALAVTEEKPMMLIAGPLEAPPTAPVAVGVADVLATEIKSGPFADA